MKPASACLLLLLAAPSATQTPITDPRFITYTAAPQAIKLYWKNDRGAPFKSIQNLKSWLGSQQQQLMFATNGGMYRPDGSPQGLFIENQQLKASLDTASGSGNFYLKPNGVFYITTAGVPAICPTAAFRVIGPIKCATQSGPLLVLNGQIHPAFKAASPNVNIRNGVGILPDNRVVFAMSKAPVNFYDFAAYFKSLGCQHALYLDGLVSRTYLPAKNWVQTDGSFGVIVGVALPVRATPHPLASSPKKRGN
ncbi:MAG: phosphodiester glycosidase family protein [Janthinobacterium lividum]